jgi:hypothetical protein
VAEEGRLAGGRTKDGRGAAEQKGGIKGEETKMEIEGVMGSKIRGKWDVDDGGERNRESREMGRKKLWGSEE